MSNLSISLATDKGLVTYHSLEEALSFMETDTKLLECHYVMGNSRQLFDPVCFFMVHYPCINFDEWLTLASDIASKFKLQVQVLPATQKFALSIVNDGPFASKTYAYCINEQGWAC